MEANTSVYGLAFVIFCLHNVIMYTHVKNKYELTTKQKAYILSIKSSFTLFTISLWMAYRFAFEENYLDNASQTQKLILVYFSSYLFCDALIGMKEYHRHMMTLSGYIHHSIYLLFNVLAFRWPYTIPMYTLFFTEELPTLLLGVGSFHTSWRNDELFGLAFFATRLVLHFVYMCIFWHAIPIRVTATFVLFLHGFWFYKWSVLMKRRALT